MQCRLGLIPPPHCVCRFLQMLSVCVYRAVQRKTQHAMTAVGGAGHGE